MATPDPVTNPLNILTNLPTASPGAPPLDAVETAQIAYDQVGKVLYVPTGTPNTDATAIDPVGGSGAFLTLGTTQTISGAKNFSGSVEFTNGINMGGTGISNMANPINPQDAATKNYVDNAESTGVTIGTNQTITGQKTFTQDILGNVEGNASTSTQWANSVHIAASGGDATGFFDLNGSADIDYVLTLDTVNSDLSPSTLITANAKGLVTSASQASLSNLSAPTSNFSLGGYGLTNGADPVNPQDLATKYYVDNAPSGEVTIGTDQTITGQKTFTQAVIGNLQGNADTSTEWANSVHIAASGGDVTGFFDLNGSADINYVLTLDPVNSDITPSTLITANAKGLVTNASQASLSNLSAPTGNFSMGSHQLNNMADPSAAQDATTRNWVQNFVEDSVGQLVTAATYNGSAFGLNGDPSCIQYATITQSGNDNSFGIILEIFSYENDSFSYCYLINSVNNATAGQWEILLPTTSATPIPNLSALWVQTEININNNVMSLRARRMNWDGSHLETDNVSYRILVFEASALLQTGYDDQSGDPVPTAIFQSNVSNVYLNNLIDVNSSTVPTTSGQVLMANGTQWENATLEASSIISGGAATELVGSSINVLPDNNLIEINGDNQLTIDLANLQAALAGTTPTFFAYLSSPFDQVPVTYSDVIQCDAILWDTTSAYNTTTYTYTPQTAGYYQINLMVNCSSGTVLSDLFANLWYNGAPILQGSESMNTSQTTAGSMLSVLLPFNGTTDNIQPGLQATGTFGGGLQFNLVNFSATLVSPFASVNSIGAMFSGYNFNTPSLTSGSAFVIPIDTINWDTASGFNTSTYMYTVSVPGYYQINLSSPVSGTVVNQYVASIYKNGSLQSQGSSMAGGTGNNAISTASAVLQCAMGDTISAQGICFGTALSLGASNIFSISFLSAS